MSQITVHSIIQDSKGFLWVGTEDGLNRYDGYKFVTYRNDKSDSTTISDNFIWSIVEDNKGNIWIGTNSGGLNKYDYATNSFTHYNYEINEDYSNRENNIRSLHFDTEGKLWIGTQSSGLFKFDVEKNHKTKQNIKIDSGTEFNFSILDIEEDSKYLWFATDGGGLIQYNKRNDSFKEFDSFNIVKGTKNRYKNIWSVLSDDKFLWVGTYGNGIIRYNINNGKSIVYNTQTPNGLSNNNITDIAKQNEFIWICTEDGLSVLNNSSSKIFNYTHNPSDIESISNNILRCIYIDRLDIIWLGTFGGGINKVGAKKRFNIYKHNPLDDNSISHNMIRSLHEDRNGNIWIGTLGNGLNKLNADRKTIERFYSSTSPNSLSDNIVTSIIEDKNGYLWVGTWGGGLNNFKFAHGSDGLTIISNKVINTNSSEPFRISSEIVQALYIDSANNLWIGTEDGLNIYNIDTKKFRVLYSELNNPNSLSDNRIQSNSIVEDRFGNIWVGTWKGLNRISFPKGKTNLENFDLVRFFNDSKDLNSLSDNRVISLYEDKLNASDSTSYLWVGTIGGGLNRLQIFPEKRKTYTFVRFTENDGLPNNVVYGILGDNDGYIWLSTNNGLSKYNPSTNTFRNYNITDGLQSNQFSWGAFLKTHNGELFFGGINGLNSFYPNRIEDNKNIPPVYITSFIVSSLSGNTDFDNRKLNPFDYKNSTVFPYDSYSLSIEFAALDFTTPESNQYEYMLEGYDKDWIRTNIPKVSYASISDGKYIFKVRGSNNDQIWNEVGSTYLFQISTPFWKTIWFITIVILIFFAIVFYLIATQIKNILAVERLRTKLAADLHDNIGSSLTEISILSEVIGTRLKDSEEDVKRNIEKISEKSRGLIDKMSDIVWLVNPKRDSLYDLILRLQDTYSELLADTNISLRSENLKSLSNISLKMEDRQHLFLIFKEAINNSITHGECTDIFLNAKVSGKKIEMILEDNGVGFSGDTRYFGNGLTNMQERAKLIGGKLFIESGVDKGTSVRYIGNIN